MSMIFMSMMMSMKIKVARRAHLDIVLGFVGAVGDPVVQLLPSLQYFTLGDV